jgi:hypothetical protein
VDAIRTYCQRIGCTAIVDPETFRRVAAWLPNQEDTKLASQVVEFARLRADIFPSSARARAALAIAAHERSERALFEQASKEALQLMESDPDPGFDAAARERVRAELERRAATR